MGVSLLRKGSQTGVMLLVREKVNAMVRKCRGSDDVESFWAEVKKKCYGAENICGSYLEASTHH